jgi:hypothetical protein
VAELNHELEAVFKEIVEIVLYEGGLLVAELGASMSWRGIGAFLLFVVLYMTISPAVGVVAFYAVDNPVVHKLIDLFGANANTAAIVGVIAAGVGILVGMILAIIAHIAIMEERPARGIGVAFILLQIAYALTFLILLTDGAKLTEMFTNPLFVQGCVACVVAWAAFRLPPFKRRPPLTANTVWWAKVVGSAGVAFLVITLFVIIAVPALLAKK